MKFMPVVDFVKRRKTPKWCLFSFLKRWFSEIGEKAMKEKEQERGADNLKPRGRIIK